MVDPVEPAEAPQQPVVVQNTVNNARPIPRVDPPAELVLSGDRESNLKTLKSRWNAFRVLTRLNEEAAEYQQALLIYTAGSEAANVIESSAL